MPTRRFGVLDIMLFVAATGIGLAIWRSYSSTVFSDPSTQAGTNPLRWYWYQSMGAAPLLSAWSLALSVAALRRPRPGRRRLFSRPSQGVGLMVGVALLAQSFPAVAYLVESGTTGFPPDKVLYVFISMPGQIGTGLLTVGIIRALTGRCRRRWADWQDGLGWLLGACWVLLGAATNFFRMLV
jgi:hypothetical protein